MVLLLYFPRIGSHASRYLRRIWCFAAVCGTIGQSVSLGTATVLYYGIVIIDEAEYLAPQPISKLFQLLQRKRAPRTFLVSNRILPPEILGTFPNAAVLTLGSLSSTEFQGFLNHTLPGHVLPKQVLQQLYKRTNGNPRMIKAALEALRAGVISSGQGLKDALSDFSSTGLVTPDGKPIHKDSRTERRIIIDVSAVNAEVVKLLHRQPDLLWQIPSRQFEELVAEILKKQGYEIELTPASSDGGFDMYAAKKDGLGSFLYLVECKRYTPPNKVGVEVVRALNGVVQSKQATAGAIATTSFFTAGAEAFQREQEHRMNLYDYLVLRRWISDYTKSAKLE